MKKTLSLILALTLCIGLSAPAMAMKYGEEYNGYYEEKTQRYSDVGYTHWAFDSIDTCTQRGWFHGYPDGTFRPTSEITREEAATVFAQALALPIEEHVTSSFIDVANDYWAARYIEVTKVLFPNVSNLQGTSSFRPKQTITREETIYALVVAWRYATKTKTADLSVLRMFSDTSSISEAVKPYMAVAVSEGLVSGFPDGTIGAQRGLSRAEFAALLARALNHGFGPDNTEAPQILFEEYASSTTAERMCLTGKISPMANGLQLTVDGKLVTLNSDGSFSADLPLAEGDNSFAVSVVNAYGVQSSTTVTVRRAPAEAPKIVLDNYDISTSDRQITVTGSVVPMASGTVLTQDGAGVYVAPDGSFSLKLSLEEGDNVFSLTVKDAYGNASSKEIKVQRVPTTAPRIILENYATSTTDAWMTVSGEVMPVTDNTRLTLDGSPVRLNYGGSFEVEVDLAEGENSFTLTVTDGFGLQSSKNIRIQRVPTEAPAIRLNQYPESTAESKVTVTGTVTPMKTGTKLTLDGREVNVDSDGSFTAVVTLEEGTNIFMLSAVNTYGKQSTQVITIRRIIPDAPEIALEPYEARTAADTLTVTGRVTPMEAGTQLTLDGAAVSVKGDGSFSLVLRLEEGKNRFSLTVTNAYKKSASETVTVEKFIPDAPVITVNSCPEKTTEAAAEVSGTVTPMEKGTTLTLDGTAVQLKADGSFSAVLQLKDGQNRFSLTAANAYKKTSEKTIVIEKYTPDAPQIALDGYDASTEAETVTVTGMLSPVEEGTTLTLDGTGVSLDKNGGFVLVLPLEPGENCFVLTAANRYGKENSVTMEIERTIPEAPDILLNSYPGQTRDRQVPISGKVSPMAAGTILTLDGEPVFLAADGSFTVKLYIETGANTFSLVATNAYGKGSPASTVTITGLVTSGEGEWLLALPEGVNERDYQIKTKTQSRVQKREETVSSAGSMSGWTLIQSGGSWGSWSSWQNGAVSASSTRKVETQQVVDTPARTEYRYGGWFNSENHSNFCGIDGVGRGHKNDYKVEYSAWSTSRCTGKEEGWVCTNLSHRSGGYHICTDGTTNRTITGATGDLWLYSYWVGGKEYYWEETRQIPATYRTQYRYQDYTARNTFERWTGWSDWEDGTRSADKDTKVETRTLYCFTAKG